MSSKDIVFCDMQSDKDNKNSILSDQGMPRFRLGYNYNQIMRYWFDQSTANYHISPCERDEVRERNLLILRKEVCNELANRKDMCSTTIRSINSIDWDNNIAYFLNNQGRLNEKAWDYYNIRLFCIQNNKKYEYLIGFSRMIADKEGVWRNIDKPQFYRYLVNNNDVQNDKTNINWCTEGDKVMFKLMYPKSDKDNAYCYDKLTGHCVYNPPTLLSTAKEIYNEFIKFYNCFNNSDEKMIAEYGCNFNEVCNK